MLIKEGSDPPTTSSEAEQQPSQEGQGGTIAARDQQRTGQQDEVEYPSLPRILLLAVGIWFAAFLVALDQTIVSNAIPTITDDFKSTKDVGWYGSAYMLTMAAFQLFYGRVYTNFSVKYTFLAAIGLFELGSLVCGVAPSSTALILGRAISGLGGSGISAGALTIIAHNMPLHYRPLFIGSMGAIFAIAAVLGPVVGGVFTTKLTWRWCFYINLPFGGVTILVILLLLKPLKRPYLDEIPIMQRLKQVDFLGLIVFIPAVVCLLLALQWGGSTYPWRNWRIILMLVLFGVLGIVFLGVEYWKGDEATFPFRLISQRSIAAAAWYAFCNGASFMIILYYVPFWHQVIRDCTAAESGIRLLPLIIGLVIMAILSGALVATTGYYVPFMILSSVIAPIGNGLMTTWKVDSSFSQWFGYQAMVGLGIGVGMQQPMIAVQTVLPTKDIPSGTSIVVLTQTLSGAIFVSVGQSVMLNQLVKNLETAIPSGSFDLQTVVNAGATQVRDLVPKQYLHAVLVAFNGALTKVYTVAVAMSALTLIGSLAMEWKSVKKNKKSHVASVEAATGAEKEATEM